MLRSLQHYQESGQLVEIIYLDRLGKTSKRTVRIYSIEGEHVRAYCYSRYANRMFLIENILAIAPFVHRHAGYVSVQWIG